jgi:hypothetical protein
MRGEAEYRGQKSEPQTPNSELCSTDSAPARAQSLSLGQRKRDHSTLMHAPWGVFRYWSHRQFAEAHKYKIGIKRSSVKPSPQARNYAIEQSALKARFNADRIFHTDTSVEDFSCPRLFASRFQRSPFCLRPPRASTAGNVSSETVRRYIEEQKTR